MTDNSRIGRPAQRDLTDKQRDQIFRVTNIGLKWIAGTMSMDEVQNELGKKAPLLPGDLQSYIYGFDGFGAAFDIETKWDLQKHHISRRFSLDVEDWITSNIPRETFEQNLGLHRVQRGELIDGVRKEVLNYFNRPILPTAFPNRVGLNLRLPLPDDLPFDVYVNLQYQRALDKPERSTFENTADFRSLEIERSYLTPEELQQRNDAKRQKYGYMGLCTGMICPETGYWEAWGANGPLDVELMKAGERYPTARNNLQTVKAGGPYAVDARYFWLCSTEQEDLAGARMVPLRRAQNG
ncbi:hypothetical protein [Caballeronia insecticola]|uniref:Uncharacterized protein n=1 Tax=Caballeronia insecticola TaxID=758793 RepID=R4WXR4_9BURK|nr:hypothetical protein [Caballeronia insecticola]BAN23886.1 putative uncharacterized protein [Caballeronia insecticola]